MKRSLTVICSLVLTCAMAFAQAKPACHKPAPPTPPPPPTPVTGTTTNTNNNSNVNTNTNTQTQNQSQVANGGSASSSSNATGGQATGGSANATGGQGGQSSISERGSNNSTVLMAPTILPTSPCTKGMSGGVTTGGFGAMLGGDRIDKSCDDVRAINEMFGIGSKLAGCKIFIQTKPAKRGHVTLEDCMGPPPPPTPTPVIVAPTPSPTIAPAPAITINVPLTVVNPAPVVKKTPVVHKAPVVAHKVHPRMECNITNHTTDTTTRVCKPCPEK